MRRRTRWRCVRSISTFASSDRAAHSCRQGPSVEPRYAFAQPRAFRITLINVNERETIDSVPVSDEQINRWADEAEAGFDLEAIQKRARGRPGRGALPSQVVALRLTTEELAAIDAYAAHQNKTRSEVIRDALKVYVA